MILGEFNQPGSSPKNSPKQSADRIDKSLAANPRCSVCPSRPLPAGKEITTETRNHRNKPKENQRVSTRRSPVALVLARLFPVPSQLFPFFLEPVLENGVES